jgi:hypothetical protein
LNLTPKALANFSPGLERSDNLGEVSLWAFMALLIVNPKILALLEPWVEISHRLWR